MSKSGGKDTTTKKWVSYFDALRVIAALAVVVLHVAAVQWVSRDINTSSWRAANFWDGTMRFAVPIFVMISGALMLNPKKKFSIKKLYSKNILRLVTAFIFWSVVYVLFDYYVLKNCHGVKEAVKEFIKGQTHMWFIYMMIGLYVITPVIRLITRNQKMMEYFLIVGLLLGFIVPGVKVLCNGWALATGNVFAKVTSELIESIMSSMRFYFATGYVIYYVLGYYLFSCEIKKSRRILCYVLGILGMVITFYYGQRVSVTANTKWSSFGELSPWVLMYSIAIFVFAKYHFERIGKSKIMRFLSPLTFGIYLAHVLVMLVVSKWILHGIQYNIVTIPLVAIADFILSMIIIWVINKIPILNRFII